MPGRVEGSGSGGVFWSNRSTCETSIPARRATSSLGGAHVYARNQVGRDQEDQDLEHEDGDAGQNQ